MRVAAVSTKEIQASPSQREVPPPRSESRFRDHLERAALQTSTNHTVRRGDTLSQIVARFLRDTGRPVTLSTIYNGVAKAAAGNGIKNPDLILVGQRIDLSVLSEAPTPSAELGRPRPATGLEPVAPAASQTRATRIRQTAHRASSTQEAAPLDAPRSSPGVPLSSAYVHGGARTHYSVPTRGGVTSPWRGIVRSGARLTSEFGKRRDPFTGRMAYHGGIDLAAEKGTRIYPLMPGRVVYSGWRGGYGKSVTVRHPGGFETVYGHNAANLVKVGDHVASGTPLGLVGSTGRSTGPHLHFEILRDGVRVDPVPYLTGHRADLARAR